MHDHDFIDIFVNYIIFARFFVSPSTCNVKNLDVCYKVRDNNEGDSGDTTTPLIEATVSLSEKVVVDLLRHGASVNFPKVTSFMFRTFSQNKCKH